MKRILIFNAGSSSLKYKLFAFDEQNKQITLEKSGEVDKIGTAEGPKNHTLALSILFEGFGLRSGFLQKIQNLAAIGHRVVHGGANHQNIEIVNDKLISGLSQLNHLAPIHNPPIIEVMQRVFQSGQVTDHRTIPNYAAFDTAFYADLPMVASIYPIPYSYYEVDKIKRYGFHGLSHKNALEAIEDKFGKLRSMISIHLGAGASITAIKNSLPVDTSMGFTPMEGLMMGTRCGDIDPGIILHLMKSKKMNAAEISNLLNFESGILGISGIVSDMKDLLYIAGYEVEDPNYSPSNKIINLPQIYKTKAKLAIEMFVYRIKKYIGAYNAILGNTDALAFTGKICCGSSIIRKMILQDMGHILGHTKILIVDTDEELQITKEIIDCLKN